MKRLLNVFEIICLLFIIASEWSHRATELSVCKFIFKIFISETPFFILISLAIREFFFHSNWTLLYWFFGDFLERTVTLKCSCLGLMWSSVRFSLRLNYSLAIHDVLKLNLFRDLSLLCFNSLRVTSNEILKCLISVSALENWWPVWKCWIFSFKTA